MGGWLKGRKEMNGRRRRRPAAAQMAGASPGAGQQHSIWGRLESNDAHAPSLSLPEAQPSPAVFNANLEPSGKLALAAVAGDAADAGQESGQQAKKKREKMPTTR